MMKQTAKELHGKMADFKRFAITLLAVGAFLYLGVIIPDAAKSLLDLQLLMLASTAFLASAIFFFQKAKKCKQKLAEMEEEY